MSPPPVRACAGLSEEHLQCPGCRPHSSARSRVEVHIGAQCKVWHELRRGAALVPLCETRLLLCDHVLRDVTLLRCMMLRATHQLSWLWTHSNCTDADTPAFAAVI